MKLGVLITIAAVVSALHGRAQEKFVPLFDGTLKGWVVENATAGNFTIRDGVLRVEAPSGWLRSERQYTDFTLRTQFRFMTADADSGIFFRAGGSAQFMRGWPNNSYQVQIRNPATASRLPAVGGLFRHGMPAGEIAFDQALVEKLSRGTGEWQELEITVAGDTLAVRFNGSQVTRAANIVNQSGHIGIQAETGAVEFRSIEVASGGGAAAAPRAQAQSDLRFEVASVRRVEIPPVSAGVPVFPVTGGVGTASPRRITYRGTWLSGLIATAFAVRADQITGPEWLSRARYDIVANIPEGATKEQFNVMLGNLLRDRFHLTFHLESKIQPVYALRVAKSGVKLKETVRRADDATPSRVTGTDAQGFMVLSANYKGIIGRPGPGEMFSVGQDVSIAELARFMEQAARRPVVDETGLTGQYDFKLHFEWGRPSAVQTTPSSAPTIFSAVEEQLGLKLEPSTSAFDQLIIDSIDREPTDN